VRAEPHVLAEWTEPQPSDTPRQQLLRRDDLRRAALEWSKQRAIVLIDDDPMTSAWREPSDASGKQPATLEIRRVRLGNESERGRQIDLSARVTGRPVGGDGRSPYPKVLNRA
jgi:hypothetical protein